MFLRKMNFLYVRVRLLQFLGVAKTFHSCIECIRVFSSRMIEIGLFVVKDVSMTNIASDAFSHIASLKRTGASREPLYISSKTVQGNHQIQ